MVYAIFIYIVAAFATVVICWSFVHSEQSARTSQSEPTAEGESRTADAKKRMTKEERSECIKAALVTRVRVVYFTTFHRARLYSSLTNQPARIDLFQSYNDESLIRRESPCSAAIAGDDNSTGEAQDENDITENQCAICLTNFDKGDKISSSLLHQCHEFHQDCLTAWLVKHDDCPCCRRALIVPLKQQKENKRQPTGDIEAPCLEVTEHDDRQADTESTETVLSLETGSDDYDA